MRAFVKGMLARSKAGHDTGKLFVVMQAEEEFVYLADGRCRTLDKQKKKRRKHIQSIYRIPALLQEKMEKGEELRDEDIRKAIKDYEKNQQEV